MAPGRGRAGAVTLAAALPAAAGGTALAAMDVHAWPPYAAVIAVSALSGLTALARYGRRRRGPATNPERGAPQSPEPVTGHGEEASARTSRAQRRADGTPGSQRSVYEMTRPVRPVRAQGLPDDPPFTVRLVVHSHIAHIASPGLLGTAEAVHIPLTGHNLLLSLTATGQDQVVLRSLRAEVTDRLPLRADGISFARQAMPDLVMSADLLESAQRAVRAYRPLRSPDVVVLLDSAPAPELAEAGADPALPLTAAPGTSADLTCAPVTDDGRWVRWRLTARIECAGRVWRPWWDLTVTATTGLSRFSPDAAPEPQPVHTLFPDHYDPRDPEGRQADPEAVRAFQLASHTSQDGQGLLESPTRPDPDPEPPGAAETIRRAAVLARAGDLPGAAEAYRSAAEAGSGQAAYLLAMLTQNMGDVDGAARWYERAAARRVPAAYNNLGVLAMLRGDLDGAERWYRRAMDTGDWAAAVGLGVVREKQGDEAQAEELWRLAGKRNVPNADQNLAVLYQRQGRHREADELFTRAAEAGDVQAAVHVGYRCHEAGDRAGAERWWRTAADAGSAEGAFYLGSLLMADGRTGEAERLWERAAEGLGTPGPGDLRTPAGQQTGTGTTYRVGGTAESGEAYAAYQLGLLNQERGDDEAALAWWTLAAGAGHMDAVFRLCELHLNVRGDLAECLRWATFALELEGVPLGRLAALAAGLRQVAEQLAGGQGAYEPDPGAAAEACSVAAEAYRRLTAHDGGHRPAWEESVRRLVTLADRSGSPRARQQAASAEARLRTAG
ncbi:tetratricopeptide repeat protein [Streptomyces sp. NPDC003273]|uniref:tetratricopeptide repeat protein n=1 Tax=Streptomyces sp. NPDC003273 TaxID=3364678 RepID=UPI0036A6D648